MTAFFDTYLFCFRILKKIVQICIPYISMDVFAGNNMGILFGRIISYGLFYVISQKNILVPFNKPHFNNIKYVFILK